MTPQFIDFFANTGDENFVGIMRRCNGHDYFLAGVCPNGHAIFENCNDGMMVLERESAHRQIQWFVNHPNHSWSINIA